jgi:hypothetical protein
MGDIGLDPSEMVRKANRNRGGDWRTHWQIGYVLLYWNCNMRLAHPTHITNLIYPKKEEYNNYFQ